MRAAARGGEEAAAPGVLEERPFYTACFIPGSRHFSGTALQWSNFFVVVVDVSFFIPKVLIFLGNYESKCFPKGVTRLPGNTSAPSHQGYQPASEESLDPALDKTGGLGQRNIKWLIFPP